MSLVTQKGTDVIPYLAKRWPQIYLLPTEEGNPLYRAVVLSGEDVPFHSLSHFQGSEEDSITVEDTPAGEVMAVTLNTRSDFETMLQILAHKCRTVPIPPTQGASILDGLISWNKIRAHEADFRKEEAEKGNADPDWDSEFKRFTSNKRNYTDALIILSKGPYSAVPYTSTPWSQEQWLACSQIIRKVHECTHFICRRLHPEWIDPLWDELVADAAGIYAALHTYDQSLAETFLGIESSTYIGGRLENYVKETEKTPESLNETAAMIHEVLTRFSEWIHSETFRDPWDLVLRLEEHYPLWWKKEESDRA